MAQVLITKDDKPGNAFQRYSLVDVFEDGVFLGNRVQGVGGSWDDPPLPSSRFWIAWVTDATRADLLWLVQPEYDSVTDTTTKKRKWRINRNAVPQRVVNELTATGRTSVTEAEVNAMVEPNPGYA